MHIVPAIDLIEGKCVRLEQGDYTRRTEYSGAPLDVARKFEDAGIKKLHLVDLDGAREGRVINYKVLELIVSKTGLAVDFGGGIQGQKDLEIAFECGAAQVNIGSAAVKKKSLVKEWLVAYGASRIILSADVKNEKIVVSGWQEETSLWLVDFLQEYREQGVEFVCCTDVSKDGMLEGPSFELYKKISGEVQGLKVIASGGVSSLKDLEQLREGRVYAVIIGKALYEGRILLSDLATFL